MINTILQGDVLEKLKELEDNSVDSVVTDPPAGISFMGKDWDKKKAEKEAKAKNRMWKRKTFIVLEFKNGFLVVSERQLGLWINGG